MSRALETISILVLSLASACYSPPQPDCGFVCGVGGACPEDYTCGADNRCRLNGTPASLMCSAPDARLADASIGSDAEGIDAPGDSGPGDAMIDAAIDAAIDAPPDAFVPMDAPADAAPDADMMGPTVMSTLPTNAATNVPRDTTITVTFDEPVVNVSTTTFVVMIGANAVAGTLTQQSATTYVFTPSSMLMPNATVTVTLTMGITDGSGNALVETTFSFMTI